MGSNTHDGLPPAASLVLAIPTADERRRAWALSHPTWGNALSMDDYLDREAYLTTVPLAMDSGVTHWILTDGTLPPGQRPILSSCETLRKHAMAAGPSPSAPGQPSSVAVTVTDGVAHGIASVFTDPQYRGKGYAGRMLREVGQRLKQWQVESSAHGSVGDIDSPSSTSPDGKSTLFSVLYSDIGKSYYANMGWAAFPSAHLSFSPQPSVSEPPPPQTSSSSGGFSVTPLGYHELTELCPIDVQLLRARLARRAARRAADAPGSGPSVALAPDLNTMLWHLMREDYMTKHIFGKTPTVRGALCTLDAPESGSGSGGEPGRGQRSMWVIWTRGYYGGLKTIEGNTLYILHVVLEDLDDDFPSDPGEVPISQQHVDGFAAILRMAQAEAAEWSCGSVQMWNPTAAQRILVDRSGIPYKEVDREKDSIASLMWNGEGATESVDWVANEKFGWY